jgi:TorA maturation chaperone TorD
MSATAETAERGVLKLFRQAAADDLLTLAVLHDRELDADTIGQLRNTAYPESLALVLESARAVEAIEMMRVAVGLLPEAAEGFGLDELAADYADIYLTYKLRASPCESVWLDEDGLTLQEPMFTIRDWYGRHGLAAENWRQRSDDHLVLQLQFISHLLASDDDAALREVTRFLDEHLLLWIFDFAGRVSTRCSTAFYAALAALTAAYLDELRDLLDRLLDAPRPNPELVVEKRLERQREVAKAAGVEDIPVVSIPAATPSW